MSSFVLNNREISWVVWLLIFFIFAFSIKEFRKSLPALVKAFFQYQIIFLFCLLSAYVSFVIYVFFEIGLWRPSMLKETIFWCIGSVFVAITKFDQIEEPDLIKNMIRSSFGITIFFGFLISAYTLNFLIEFLVLIPILVILQLVSVVSSYEEKNAIVKNFVDNILALIGFGILFYVIFRIYNNFSTFWTVQNLRMLVLPLLLTFGMVPFVYVLALFNAYQFAFLRLKGMDKKLFRTARLQLFKACFLKLSSIRRFSKYQQRIRASKNKVEILNLFNEFKKDNKDGTDIR